METHDQLIHTHDDRQSRRSFLLGIAVWFIHQNTIYALSSLSCKWTWFPFHLGSITGIQIIETAVSLIALALIGYFLYLAWQQWRKFQSEKPPENPHMLEDTEKDRRPLMAFIAMMSNTFFLLFVLGSFVIIFSLNSCVQG
jgi:hypothetical protein